MTLQTSEMTPQMLTMIDPANPQMILQTGSMIPQTWRVILQMRSMIPQMTQMVPQVILQIQSTSP
jgi:hypothetical protein